MDDKKECALNEVIEYYINSKDFNGLSVSQMETYDYVIVCNLTESTQ